MSIQMAFVGLGPMGQGMSRRLAGYGKLDKPLLMFNRTLEVTKDHVESIGPAAIASTLDDLVDRSDVIWTCLADDDAVRGIYSSMITRQVKGKLFVECSTISAETTTEINNLLRHVGADLIAMPVFGQPGNAVAGQLIAVPAGRSACIDIIRPYLIGVIASDIVEFPDEDPSKANLLKLMGNVLIMTTIEQISEMMVFAEKAGLGTTGVEKLLSALYPGGPRQHSKYASLMTSGEYHKGKAIIGTGAAIKLSTKILGLAKSLDVQLKGYEVAIQHLMHARDAAGPESDIIGVYGAVRQESGLEFKN